MVPFSFEEWDFDPFSDWKPAWRLCDWAQYGTMIVYKPAYESCSGRCRRKKLLWFFFLVNHSGVKSFKSPTGGSVRELGILPKMPFSFGNASECAGYDYSHFRDLCNKNDFPNKKRGHIFVMWWFLFLPALFRTGDFYMVKKPIPFVWYIYIYILYT